MYEIHVRSFQDSNGDGIGDFAGIQARLPYLADLGVDTLWLLPFLESPLRDDGYDIADYFAIPDVYGGMAGFKALLDAAHALGMRVITELVLNHTSDQHPWFQEARHPASPRHDWYVWSDSPERYKDVRIIFSDTEPSNWTWDDVAQKFYWHRFFHHQPDLNFDHPDVRQALLDVAFFWLDLGVDGLRLDAVPYLFEREGTSCENLPETLAYIASLREAVDARYGVGQKALLAEANQGPEDTLKWFADGKGVHMAFHFPLMPRLFIALATGRREAVVDILRRTHPLPDTAQWALFLRNHDELTLEMVTEVERELLLATYAPDPAMTMNGGIRRRLAPLLCGDARKIVLLHRLLLALPGTPVLYYGDEIGMGDLISLPDRNGVRTPMQWNATPNGGFSSASARNLYLPAIQSGPYGYEEVSVERAQSLRDGLWGDLRALLHARKARAALLGDGDMEIVEVPDSGILAFTRTHGADVLLAIANLTPYPRTVHLPVPAGWNVVRDVVQPEIHYPCDNGEFTHELPPFGARWLEAVSEGSCWAVTHGMENFLVPSYRSKPLQAVFEQALKRFLPAQRWFAHKATGVDAVHLADAFRVRPDVYLAHVQISSGGMASMYQLPLIALPEAVEPHAGALLSFALPDGTRWALCDGASHPACWEALIGWWQGGHRQRSDFAWYAGEWRANELFNTTSTPLKGEQSNASALVGGKAFLKLYRTLHEGPNPEVELLQALSEAGVSSVPRVMGVISREGPTGTTPLALAVEALNAPKDAWGVMLDYLRNDQLDLALDLVSRIGTGLAEIHRALGTVSRPDFTPTLLPAPNLEALRDEVRATREVLSQELQSAVEREIAGMAELDLGMGTRIHGDLHLGQIVLANNKVTFLDFEGEPARTLAQRRALDSPLRDVAGLLRSLHYALATVYREKGQPPESLELSLTHLSDALWKAWHPAMAQSHLLPPHPISALRYYVLQKVLYEIRYEQGSRPDWVWIPLSGLIRFIR